MHSIHFSVFSSFSSDIWTLSKWIWVLLGLFLFFPESYSQVLDPPKTIHISSSEGDDTNEGSILFPKKTLNGLPDNLRKNHRILLKKGDVFYENLSHFDSCVISSYGTGNAPLLCGFRRLESNKFWERESANIWKIDMYRTDAFTGYSLPAGKSYMHLHNIGFIYDETNNEIHGRLVEGKDLLTQKWDVFTSNNGRSDQEFRFVSIFHENPQLEQATFCFPVYECGITFLQNCHISGIAIQGFSLNGIDDLYNCTVENCAIDLIGGGIQLDNPGEWKRQGNGIECWINGEHDSANHNLFSHCWISRVYGSGASIQGESASVNAVSNKFINNVFSFCRQAFSHSLRGSKGVEYIDCEFSKNICYLMGENGFDSPEEWDANLLSQETILHQSKIKAHHNFFWGSNHIFGDSKFFALDMKYSVIFIFKGQYLNTFSGNYNAFYASSFPETTRFHAASKDKDYVYIIDPKEIKPSVTQYQTYLETYFSSVNTLNLPDIQGLDKSLFMLRFIAGQREF